jgi:tetratricopeptide (TPR) repeat protein
VAKAEHHEPPPAPAAADTARASWLRRLLANRFRVLLLIGGVVAIIGVAAGLTLTFWSAEQPSYVRQLGQAFAKYQAGEFREARQIAARLLTDKSVRYSDHGGAYYILGAITLHEADQQINPAKQQLLDLVAARYLEEARNRGVPQTREGEALWQLGRALHDAGRYARSVTILREALEFQPEHHARIHALLADGYLNLQPPRLTEALEHNRQYLATSGLSQSEIDVGRLAQGRILLAQQDVAGATAAIDQIADSSAVYFPAQILRGRILLALPAGAAATESADQATLQLLEQLRQLEGRAGTTPALLAQSQLLIGLLHHWRNEPAKAEAQYDHVRRVFFGQPEALAAAIFQGDLIRPDRPSEAVALYKRGISQVAGTEEAYNNHWLPAEQFRSRLQAAVDDLAERELYALALDLAEALIPPFSHTVAVERQATIHRAWARQLAERAQREKLPQAQATAAEARLHWREAGAHWRRLADLRITTRMFLDDLAASADDFRRGQGYLQAETVYRELLRQEPQQGEPEALVGLGEVLLALGKVDAALPVLARCREAFPKHPASYRARILASLALQEQGQLPQAQELLLDNLYGFSLSPQSSEWRDSLFELGKLLYLQGLDLESKSRQAGIDKLDAESRRAGLLFLDQSHGLFEEAIHTLREAVERYPTAPQATESRYCIAEAHRHSAKLPRKRLAGVTIETSRADLERQMHEHLLAAIAQYNQLITSLSAEQEAPRSAVEATTLRNCYFGRADALFDLNRYDDAIEAYSAATNRYQNDPESLEAYVQIASCHRRLGRLSEARGTLEQARVVLQRIRPDADFLATTRLARQDWVYLLDWLRTL